MKRSPVVSGKFYADDSEDLKSQIKNCFFHPIGPGSLPKNPGRSESSVGLVVPHAGYMASGPVAAWSYWKSYSLITPSTVIIIGPNHTGLGTRLSLWNEDSWDTPLGEVEIDKELGKSIMTMSSGLVVSDTTAHLYEHSIEVQLPFLQFLYRDFKIVPIIMSDQRLEVALMVSGLLRKILSEKSNLLIIASSDLNHYESHETTIEKDRRLVNLVKERKYAEAYEISRSERITACGLGPMVAVRETFESMDILCNTTSGEVIGDRYRTVGYLAALLK